MSSTVASALQFVKTFDPLEQPTQSVKNWLQGHPTAFRVVLIANHYFRAAMMAGFMMAMPYSAAVNGLICLSGTLFYRFTIQGNCPYKLDLTSLFGATAFLATKNGVLAASSVLSYLPLTAYALYVVISSEAKSETRSEILLEKKSCCSAV